MPSPAKYASNNHGVGGKNPSKINFDAPGSVTSKTYHGISIVVDGNIVGRIQTWQPQMYSRQGEHVYELNHLTFGRPVDYVPGINENYKVNCSRVEVWNEELEKALGYPSVWSDLIDQDRPFTVQEYLFRGVNVYKVWEYTGCWFQEKNTETFNAKETPQIMTTATLAFVSRTSYVG